MESDGIRIAPSLLSADFAHLSASLRAVDRGGADFIHLDVMDGHFVPNITFGAPIISSLRSHSSKPFDTHLMISPVMPYIESFARAGSDIITFHIEAESHPHRILGMIRECGCRAGIALNPGTPLSLMEDLLDSIDVLLIMSVNPGFPGQRFIGSMVEKIGRARALIDRYGVSVDLEVDGGIDAETAPLVRRAGADILVAGSSIFSSPTDGDYSAAIEKLRG